MARVLALVPVPSSLSLLISSCHEVNSCSTLCPYSNVLHEHRDKKYHVKITTVFLHHKVSDIFCHSEGKLRIGKIKCFKP